MGLQSYFLAQLKTITMAKRNNMFKVSSSEIAIKEGFNIRTDYGDIETLANSIEQEGIKVPLIGHKENGMFIPTDGHRRFKAVQYLQSQGRCMNIEIPFCVQPKDYTEEQRTLDLFRLNDGKRLTLFEEALLFQRLKDDFGMNNTKIASKIGKSSMHVGNCLLLLDAPQELLDYVEQEQLSATTLIDQLRKDKDGQVTLGKIQMAIEENEGKTITKKHIKEVEAFDDYVPQEKSFSDKLAEANEAMAQDDNMKYHAQPNHTIDEDNYQERVEPTNDAIVVDNGKDTSSFSMTYDSSTQLQKGLNLAITELSSFEDLTSVAVVNALKYVEELAEGEIDAKEFCNKIQNHLL